MQKEISGGATPKTRWRFDVTIPNNEIAGVAATNTQKLSLITGTVATGSPAAGALVFDSAGKLTSAYLGTDPAAPPPLANLKVPPASVTMPALSDGATFDASGITWTLVSDSGSPNVTAFSNPSVVTSSNQNGAPAGSLNNLTIQGDCTLAAVFSNGKTVDVAQMVLAQFGNVDGLLAQGNGLFAESPVSGASIFGAPGADGRGLLQSGALEQSTVDLATELTKVITFQRGYQANARIITATDQILQETINLSK